MANKMLLGILVISAVLAISLQAGCDENSKKAQKQVQKGEKTMATPEKSPKKVIISTTKGDIAVELNEEKAPISCENFLQYVQDKYYDGMIFHRVIKGFMIQGGGKAVDNRPRQLRPSILNEAKNGLKNDRGTIAMARTPDPDSATSQFFINVANNDFLNYGVRDAGYAVFGKVVSGMDVVDKIAAVPTGPGDVPVETITINSIRVE